MSERRRLAATLLHDVGKYVARAARNLRPGEPIVGPLASMLLRDVYETHRGRPASARFDELAPGLAPDTRLDEARAHLAAIDAAESAARAGDPGALASVAERAREVETLLRAIAREASS